MIIDPNLKICLITPPDIGSPDLFYPRFEEALSHGIRFVQFRNKQLTKKEGFRVASRLSELCRQYRSLFIVNDEIDMALALDSDGIHIGQQDFPLDLTRNLMGPGKIIGVSTHSFQQAAEAESGGADYIGFGPVFYTPSKENRDRVSLETLKLIRKEVAIPIFAIGGISPTNVSSIFAAGASGIAVIFSIWNEPSVGKAVDKLQQEIQNLTRS